MGMPKSDRLLYILNLLRARKNLNAGRLAEECGVTERSIYRDIISLSEANVPIYYDHGYKLASDNFLPPLNFTLEEYSSLKLALESSPLAKTGKHAAVLDKIRAKVEANLSSQVKREKKTAVDTTHIDIPVSQGQSKGERFYGRIEEAISNSQSLQLIYDSLNSGQSTRVVDPYFIIFRGRAFYFVAYCHMREEFRTFRVDRIAHVNPIERFFVRQPGVNATDYFEGSWEVFSGEPAEVVIRFRGMGAKVILAGQHHPDELVEKTGRDEVNYRVTVNGLEEIRKWILGFGAEAIVLEPEELRHSIRKTIGAMKTAYDTA